MVILMEVLGGRQVDDERWSIFLKTTDGKRLVTITMPLQNALLVLEAHDSNSTSQRAPHRIWADTLRMGNISLTHLLFHAPNSDGQPRVTLQFKRENKKWKADCFADDGLALALYMKAPILFEESTLSSTLSDSQENNTGTVDERLRLFHASHEDIPKA